MAKSNPRNLAVKSCSYVSPNMRRIRLGGEAMASFPVNQESAYIKLMFASVDTGRPITRTYTIRNHYQESGDIDVDFVIHGDAGPASAWAANAKVGDSMTIDGPGPKKLLDNSADWFLLAGDMTALPAISANLKNLPDNAMGYAVIEILDEQDKQELQKPASMAIHWVVNSLPTGEVSPLFESVVAMPWLQGRPSIWAACEFSTMRALRKYFKQDRAANKKDLYVSSYWKHGMDEGGHKIVKSKDSKLLG